MFEILNNVWNKLGYFVKNFTNSSISIIHWSASVATFRSHLISGHCVLHLNLAGCSEHWHTRFRFHASSVPRGVCMEKRSISWNGCVSKQCDQILPQQVTNLGRQMLPVPPKSSKIYMTTSSNIAFATKSVVPFLLFLSYFFGIPVPCFT